MNYPLDVYEGVSQFEIEARRQTSEGKEYTLNHPQELVVNMRYKGIDSSSANSQGWERNSTYYFKELLKNHPEYFSKKNTIRIQNGESPRVDARFIQAFPQYSGFENDILIHHHVGKDGQAVAVPQSIHKGSGEIHIYENKLGITDNAKEFSDLCRTICENDPEMINHTSDQFKDSSKTMNHSEPEVKPDTDIHEDIEDGEQEIHEASEEKVVEEQKSVHLAPKDTRDHTCYHQPVKKRNWIKQKWHQAKRFYRENAHIIKPIVGEAVRVLGPIAVNHAINKGIEHAVNSNRQANHSPSAPSAQPPVQVPTSSPAVKVDDALESVKRASPIEHSVSGYSRIRNGKTEYVKSYPRGGKKE